MILYRPVGLQELALIYDSGMKAFPADLPQQPIFYPVLDLEYARQTASDWNVKNGQFAGYVTQFNVEDQYIRKFERHTVGNSQYEEFWIPADEMEEFNKHLVGRIKVVEAYFGDAFQGFIPDQFGLQGKKAVQQFTLLSNSYIYKRMDFYLEIKRNHKAVFLNYPFWQKHNFKNPGLKEKIIQAIKEAWFTSFPQIPLVTLVSEDTKLASQTDLESSNKPVEDIKPAKPGDLQPPAKFVHKDVTPVKPGAAQPPAKPVHQDDTSAKQAVPTSLPRPVHEDTSPVEQTDSRLLVNPVREMTAPHRQKDLHLEQGIHFGINGNYHEAVDELSRAIEEDPNQVVAHTSLGVAYHRLGDDERAISCYETALKLDPKYAEAHYFRASVFYEHGDAREAITGYTIAIGLDPELIEAHQNPIPQDRLTDYTDLPVGIHRIAKPAYRILDLNKALEDNPRQAGLWKERAAEYSRLWNHEQAIADYSAFLAIHPDDANVLHLRGLAYEQLGQPERARQDYQQAVALDPHLPDVYINRGIEFAKMGNFHQSIASLTNGIRLVPQNPDGYFNRGITYFQQGDFKSAVDDFSNVIRLSPNDDAAYYWRGASNEESGRQPDAINDYRQFLTLSQDPQARQEVEQKLRQWNAGKPIGTRSQEGERKNSQNESEKPTGFYGLIAALGDRALDATWFGIGVNCSGEKADELYAFTDNNRPIQGHDLLYIASGIGQIMEGDFTVFDPEATSPWLFIRAWEGSGFYIETNDPKSRKRLKAHFQSVEEVEGAHPPYEGFFIHM